MLDNIIKYSIQNKVIVAFATLALIIWGIWSATKLPIDALPDITDNQVQIITRSPTLAAQEVEQYITSPIEKSLSNLPNIVEKRSFSRFGLSVITVVFKDEVDVYFARQLINEKLKEVEKEIPKSMGVPELAPVTTGLGEIYQYVIRAKKGSEYKYTPLDLRTMQDWIVARQLYGIEGVAEVTGFGGITKQYEVALKPDQLIAMQVTIPEIFKALESNNENTGGAYIDKKPYAYFIRGVGVLKSFEDIGNIVVKMQENGTPVLIKDVAKVQFGNSQRYGALTYNGESEVTGGVVMMLKGANSSEVVKAVKNRMESIKNTLPKDIEIDVYLDRTNLVNRAIATVEKNLIEGALIVIFVLVLFLGNFRAGFIVASSIPLSLLFALGLMHVFGVSANLMSLGAIDFGLIVDGSLIIVEATLHHLGLRKKIQRFSQTEMDEEVYASASKIRTSAAFGEVIILIVYIPILTLVGVEGKMFSPMALTVGFAILGSLILSLTYIPMMCALFLSKDLSPKANFSDKMMHYLQTKYQKLLVKAIDIKYAIVSATLALVLFSMIIFGFLGGEFIPTLEEGDYAIEFGLPLGSSLSQTTEIILKAEKILKKYPEVKMVVGKTGAADVATDPMPMHASDIMVILKDKEEWQTKDDFYQLADKMKLSLEAIPGVTAEPSQPIQMRFNELMTGIKQDVAIKIFGEDLDTLAHYAHKVKTAIAKIPGISEPQIEQTTGLPQISIDYNRSQLAANGLNISDVNQVVSTAFAGSTAGYVFENERKFELVLRLDSAERASIEQVSDLIIPTKNGNQIPLSQLAEVSYKQGPAQISREDGKRRVYVSFNVNGRDVETVVHEIQGVLKEKVNLPTGYYFTYGGTFENLQKASQRLLIAVPISLLLIFCLLYFTFHSIKQAGLIFTAIPMSAIGGVVALQLRDMPFSISAGIGFIALFGVAVLNGIVLIGTFNQLEKEGELDIIKRIMKGTKERLRPVLMTALVASLGFLPMALSNSAGAEVQKPLATVVIGGLVSATLLTLFVLPLLYLLFHSKKTIKNVKMPSLVLLVIGFFGLSYHAKAQDNVLPKYSLDDLIGLAQENNLDVLSKQLGLQSAQVLVKSSFELPKTDLNFQYGQYNSIQNDNGFRISQSIPFPSYFKAKLDLNKALVVSKEWQLELSKQELKAKIKHQFFYLMHLKQQQKQLFALDYMYSEMLKTCSLRYKTGETKLLEKVTAEAKKGAHSLLISENEVDIKKAYSSLKMLIQTKGDFEIITFGTPLVTEQAIPLDTMALIQNPTILALQQASLVQEKNTKLEKAILLPNLSLGYINQTIVGVQNIRGQDVSFGRSKRFQGLDIGISLPLTFLGSNQRIKAMDILQKSQYQLIEMEFSQLKSLYNSAYLTYLSNIKKYNYYITYALPNALLIEQTAKKGFDVGEIGYVEYLQAIETSADIQSQYSSVMYELNQSIIALQFLTNK